MPFNNIHTLAKQFLLRNDVGDAVLFLAIALPFLIAAVAGVYAWSRPRTHADKFQRQYAAWVRRCARDSRERP